MDGSMNRSFPLRALRLALIACAILAAAFVLPAGQALAAGGEPTIVSESVSGVGEHDATLEAQIDTGGLETTYAFWLGHEVCASPLVECYIAVAGPLGEGRIAAGAAGEAVSAVLTGLEVDTPYVYAVSAVNSAGHVLGVEKLFRTLVAGGVKSEPTPLPAPESKITPFERPAEAWVGKSAAEGAQKDLEEVQKRHEEREAANKPPAAIPFPKGEWCGEAGVTCEGGETIKPKPKTPTKLRSEKLAKALKACRKDHSRTRRASCEKQARHRVRGKTKARKT